MSDVVLAVIAFLVVIGPLILIHELGHFIAARLIGVTVLEFGIGFPPRAVKLFEQNGTEFTLNWLPIGGFVRPLGEDFVRPVGESATDEERAAFEKRQAERSSLEKRKVKTKSLMEAGPWQRIFFMIAGVGMNLLTGFVLFVIVAMLGVPGSVQVTAVEPKSPAEQAGIKVNDIIVGLNGEKVESSQDYDDIVANRNLKSYKVTVKRGASQVDLVVKLSETPLVGHEGIFISEVAPDSPADKAGLKSGDRIVKIDDVEVKTNEDVTNYNSSHLGQQVNLTYERDGVLKTVPLVPRKNPPANQGPIGTTIAAMKTDPSTGWQLGSVEPLAPLPLGAALSRGASDTLGIIRTVIAAPVNIIRGTLSVQQARPASIIGISQMGAQVIQKSVNEQQGYPILQFAAIISIAIGLTQLIPIPGLDGGRILFVLVELLRGKPIDPEREGMVHLIGLMVLLGFMAIFIVNDIINPLVLPK